MLTCFSKWQIHKDVLLAQSTRDRWTVGIPFLVRKREGREAPPPPSFFAALTPKRGRARAGANVRAPRFSSHPAAQDGTTATTNKQRRGGGASREASSPRTQSPGQHSFPPTTAKRSEATASSHGVGLGLNPLRREAPPLMPLVGLFTPCLERGNMGNFALPLRRRQQQSSTNITAACDRRSSRERQKEREREAAPCTVRNGGGGDPVGRKEGGKESVVNCTRKFEWNTLIMMER